MPEKLGKGGAGMQNYVPAGNGNASGEYGDNASGSNVHFKVFKKPDSDTKKTNKPVSDKKDISGESPAKDKKEKPKKQFVVDTEKRIKSMLGDNATISLDGFDEETCGVLENTISKVLEDFPALKTNLISIGSVSGYNKTQEKEYQKKYDEFIKRITPEKIENKRQKLIEWNPNSDKSRWTDEYVKDIIMQTEKPYREKRLSLKRGAYGACYSYSGNTISWLVFKDGTGKKKHIDTINYAYNTGLWSSNNENQTFAHELGHSIENLLTKDINYIDKINKLYDNATADELSGYSRENTREFVAESFAAYYGGMNNPVANEVVEFIKDRYRSQYK